MAATHYEKARLDARERWNVGEPRDWAGFKDADDVFTVLCSMAKGNSWDIDIEQTSADADVIWEWIEAYRQEHATS
jgi:hypothetical protein